MHLIERVGSYVGLVSFLGLAILALLYFSQARDVRRLREWAGRAPERTTETAVRSSETEAVPPVTAQLPAAQHHLPATPFSESAVRKRKPIRERIRNVHLPDVRYVALVAAGLVVLGGAAFGAVRLVGGNGNDNKAANSNPQATGHATRGAGKAGQNKAVNVDPSRVTVAVLNGTTVQGLAAKISQQVSAGGFTLGTIGNAAKIAQSRPEVLYRKGQAAAPPGVANRVGIAASAPAE